VKRRVAIVGGGVAGIAAAIRLAEAGCEPIVIETRPRLGGRATSFVDPRTGYVLDNCQHVVLGCCTNILDLYARLGVLDAIEWHRTLYWTRGHGIIDTMRPGLLPAPLHFLSSLRRMRSFDGAQKKHIGRAMRRILKLGRSGRFQWRDRTFAEFLADCDQPGSVISGFWNTVIISACNLDVGRVGAASALQVFQDGFLNHRWSSAMGLSTVPLLDLYDAAEPILRESGGEIRLGESARSIAFDGSRVTGVVTGDDLVEASAVISAVPWDRLDKLASESLRTADARLQDLDRLDVSPILGVHLHFDREIMTLPHLILIDRGVQWLFNKGVDDRGAQHVHAVISAADDWMPLDEVEIVARVVDDVHHVLPGARGIDPVEARAVKEKRATFAATPESERFRPAGNPGYVGLRGGGVENLFLAGDWCDTGWPATMEGAARSGYAAAHALTGEGGVVEDVPIAWLARALGLK
jgi:squalene-associated FAD-dependent desaturase